MANTLQAQQARKSPGLIPISQQKLAQRKLIQAQQPQYKEPTQEEIDAYVAQEVEKAKIANEKAINETINIWAGRLEFYRKRILQLEEPNDFVCATGVSHSVRELCEYVFTKLGLNYEDYVKLDMKFLRPEELTDLKGDPTKLMKATGWKPTYTFETMLDEMIEYWKHELNKVF
jgi:GDPmannose 4,6-dehydratase